MKGIYITIYKHRNGSIYVQLNKTLDGQTKFVEELSKNLFDVIAMGYQDEKEFGE